jgi:hypothetical protein
MALPEYRFELEAPLTPADVTAETLEMFARHVAQTERGMLQDVFRERIRVEMPFQSTAGDEADIFRSIWSDV